MIEDDDNFTADEDALNQDRIKRLIEETPAFSNELSGFKTLYRDYTSKKAVATKTINGLRDAYMTEMKPVYEMIHDRHAAKLKEIKGHADFLALKHSSLSYSAKLRAFNRKWQVTPNQLHRFLFRNPEVRLNVPKSEYSVSYNRLVWKFKRHLRIRR